MGMINADFDREPEELNVISREDMFANDRFTSPRREKTV
jgi:hypothetical protein